MSVSKSRPIPQLQLQALTARKLCVTYVSMFEGVVGSKMDHIRVFISEGMNAKGQAPWFVVPDSVPSEWPSKCKSATAKGL